MPLLPNPAGSDASEFSGFESSLAARCFGRPFHYHSTLGSTNGLAMELARQGAPEGCLVLADTQTAGRGRLGRQWLDEKGKSLLFSLVLRPFLPPQAATRITLALALAVANSLQRFGVPAEIKWPNDVLVKGRKACGILVEMEGQWDRLEFMVAGVGLNVNQSGAGWPEALEQTATSLFQEKGRITDRRELLADLLEEFEGLYFRLLKGDFSAILQEWQALSCMTGRQVRVLGQGGRELLGMAIGVDPDGALQVRLDNGIIERIVAGDVELVRERRL